jgi:hypothetical protein
MIALLVLVLLAAGAGTSFADPDPLCCLTSLDASQRLLLIPDNDGADPSPFGSFTVTINNPACNPVPDAIVEVTVHEGPTTGLCGSATTVKLTDAHGIARFNIPGGGCFKGPHAVIIRANGVTVREFQTVMSPDYAGWDNAGIPDRWSLSVTVLDFVSFATAFADRGASCHDYNNDGTTGAVDLSIFGQTWLMGTRRCSP